jgi:hypothetical protein
MDSKDIIKSQTELCKEVRHIVYDICVREMIDHMGIPIVQHCKYYADLVKTRCNEKVTPIQKNHP